MFRIRFHGRGGQGVKTASRILGSAFFLEGYRVQDAPRYGAERRGAPIFAYVRAGREPIDERGVIARPDLVVCVDDSLLRLPGSDVLEGVTAQTPMILVSQEEDSAWRERLKTGQSLIVISLARNGHENGASPHAVTCAGAAAALTGKIPAATLREAVRMELGHLGEEHLARNLESALSGYHRAAGHAGLVREGAPPEVAGYRRPRWILLENESAGTAAPIIYAAANSGGAQTGLWRTERPVINREACKHCWWVCATYCPDNALRVRDDGTPEIDYEHCKGCMICAAQCPSHAILTLAEPVSVGLSPEGGPA